MDYLKLDMSNPLDRRDAAFVETLAYIGRAIGYGRAQQLLGQIWDHEHDCAPRGSMGVTAKDLRREALAADAAMAKEQQT
jgi:hypothetical protein